MWHVLHTIDACTAFSEEHTLTTTTDQGCTFTLSKTARTGLLREHATADSHHFVGNIVCTDKPEHSFGNFFGTTQKAHGYFYVFRSDVSVDSRTFGRPTLVILVE